MGCPFGWLVVVVDWFRRHGSRIRAKEEKMGKTRGFDGAGGGEGGRWVVSFWAGWAEFGRMERGVLDRIYRMDGIA